MDKGSDLGVLQLLVRREKGNQGCCLEARGLQRSEYLFPSPSNSSHSSSSVEAGLKPRWISCQQSLTPSLPAEEKTKGGKAKGTWIWASAHSSLKGRREDRTHGAMEGRRRQWGTEPQLQRTNTSVSQPTSTAGLWVEISGNYGSTSISSSMKAEVHTGQLSQF